LFRSNRMVGEAKQMQKKNFENNHVMGVDIGTTNIKAMIFSSDGKIVGKHSEEVTEYFPVEGFCEQDVNEVWEVFSKCIRKAINNSRLNPEQISGIAFDSNRCGCILLDEYKNPLTRSISFRDNRSVEQVKRWTKENESIDLYKIAGEEGLPQHTLFKLIWLKENEPQLWSQAKYICFSAKDYVFIKLFGLNITSMSIAQSSGLLNINNLDYSQEIIDSIGVCRNMLPKLANSTDLLGKLNSQMAKKLGLAVGTPVYCGLCDATASQLGSGSISEGMFTVSIGTCAAVRTFVKKPRYEADRSTQVRVMSPFGYVPSCTITDAGGILKWYRTAFCNEESKLAAERSINEYEIICKLAEDAPPGSNGLFLMPSFTGASYVFKNPDVFGAFIGIRNYHTKAHFTRAVLEGVSFSIKIAFDRFRKNNFLIHQINMVGGGSKSPLWCQITADILGVRIVVPKCKESGCLGSAIIAALGIGMFSNINEAVESMVVSEETYEPNTSTHELYNKSYNYFEALYESMENSGVFNKHRTLMESLEGIEKC
jgi:gluconokinase